MFSCVYVVFALCFGAAFSGDVYKAAIVDSTKQFNVNHYEALIHEAVKSGADILILPEEILSKTDLESCGPCANNYDEIVKTVSNAAQSARMYVVTHVNERIKCQQGHDFVRSNLVFDRRGDVVSVYRKPLNNANCNTTFSNTATFSTDFGVKFEVIMEEDLVVKNVKDMALKNYVLLGAWGHENQFLSASHFASSWAYITKANVISTNGVHGNTGTSTKYGNIIVNVLEKAGNAHPQITTSPSNTVSEDWRQYIIRPLDLDRSTHGYTESVCHGQFCCQFYVKTEGSKHNHLTYGLVAYDGLFNIGRGHIVGSQSCALVACAGLYKRSCFVQSENNSTNVNFEKITISGNFSKNAVPFPTFLTTTETTINNFDFEQQLTQKHMQVNAEINNIDNLLRFGIFSREYESDFVSENNKNSSENLEFSNYISSENVEEFFDYVWIRLRIVILVVSIYILEMM
ncbi:vanin-like protein 1 [Colias croceus]|uniref:vanin-like protein 1 n=1 Tax=Colias crocea TaxID=72248 RepID=UPI001E279E59|nr:vanin-like protein 1 [Colias croceus]